ncbi:Molybdenum transport system permease protein ModB [Labilithrix luteola]|uniref:Molybdenum transport system permease n=1 Tax=Labilithrix luteola TaxID=1391654 RepID=A0A0K1PK41_9BACT|nr:molybdate ABC transporter permease subunit [Labilithrix luteola]AKU93479.1 Molybdenum transport system permease protein ModB [Labilithrix luteola]
MTVALDPLLLSFEVASIATAVAAVIGIGVAAILANLKFPGRDLVDVIFTAPMVMPPTVLGYYVLVVLGRQSMLGRLYESLTGSSIVFTRTGAVVAAVIGALPLVVKSVRASFEDTDPTLMLAARTLGARPLRAFLSVQLPLATRGIVAALMLAFARSLGDFGVTLMVAGDIPGHTQTAALAIYDAIQAHRESDAAWMVFILTALVVVLLYVVGKLTARRGADS